VKLPPSTYFIAANRGYPDLASVGTGIIIYSGGLQTVGGTSASCPTVAGIMGLLNAHKLKKTGTALGPLNPFLYDMHEKSPHCFNDITAGG
jgi:tripeptidyl-peptidase-1